MNDNEKVLATLTARRSAEASIFDARGETDEEPGYMTLREIAKVSGITPWPASVSLKALVADGSVIESVPGGRFRAL